SSPRRLIWLDERVSIKRARRRRQLARRRRAISARTTCPTPPPCLIFPKKTPCSPRRGIQRSPQHVAAISSTFSTFCAPYPTLRLSTLSVSYAATPATNVLQLVQDGDVRH
ncbi:hypothetical protein K523DRAFT_422377, partial [Schizophyllum commune Tattone D]